MTHNSKPTRTPPPKFHVGQVVGIWGCKAVGKIRMKRWIGPNGPEKADSWCYWLLDGQGYFPEAYLRNLTAREAKTNEA